VRGRPPTNPLEGPLVDVGAGGLRLRCAVGEIEPGARVRLEILLEDPDQPTGPPRLVLDGVGCVVWVQCPADGDPEAGIRFDAPVDVRPSFLDVSAY
jgi:hypothetical protein